MIRKSNDSEFSDALMSEFEKELEKKAVRSVEKDNDLFNQINNVIRSKKQKFSSVSDMVEEMKERSGLNKFIKTRQAQKVANQDVLQKHPEIKQTIKNYIEETKGTLPTQAILDKIKSLFKTTIPDEQFWNDEALIKHISSVNYAERINNPKESVSGNLGKNLFKNDEAVQEMEGLFGPSDSSMK